VAHPRRQFGEADAICTEALHELALETEAEAEAKAAQARQRAAAGLDEGLLLVSLPRSCLYGELLCERNAGDE
jgi:hypothetical protein